MIAVVRHRQHHPAAAVSLVVAVVVEAMNAAVEAAAEIKVRSQTLALRTVNRSSSCATLSVYLNVRFLNRKAARDRSLFCLST